MSVLTLLRPAMMGALFIRFSQMTPAQEWTLTSAPSGVYWSSIACSADGSQIVAADGQGQIYISTNFGNSWILNQPAGHSDVSWFTSVGATANGGILAALDTSGNLLVSSNLFSSMDFLAGGSGFSFSADGKTIISTPGNLIFQRPGPISISTNSGIDWHITSTPSNNWSAVACSADGTKMVAFTGPLIFASSDSGMTWNSNSLPVEQAYSIAGSADFSSLVVPGFGYVAISTNLGVTWTSNSVAPNIGLGGVACSADGTRLVARGGGGVVPPGWPVYISTDAGLTWTNELSSAWSALACSADGHRLYAAGTGIWTFQSMPAPVLKLASLVDNIVLSWTIPSMKFVLQQSADPNGAHFTDLSVSPAINYSNLTYEVSLPRPASTTFYRLISR